MAATLPTVWYANFGNGSSTGYYAVTAWATNVAKAAGALIRQSAAPAVGNERVFVCIIAGTTHTTTEPTWTVTKGAKTTDGIVSQITWQECTGQPAVNGDVTNTPASSTERSQAVSLGLIIKNNGATHYFICSTAGTCGAGEPSYGTTAGNTTADNTATWTCLGAVGSFTAWNAPHARVANALASTWAANGDSVYVSAIHAETQSSALTWAKGADGLIVSIYCIAQAGTIPPTNADLTTGATVTTTGTSGITVNGTMDLLGIALIMGTTSGPTFTVQGGWVRFTNSALKLGPGTTTAQFSFGAAGAGKMTLINTPLTFSGTASQIIQPLGGSIIWKDTATALVLSSGSWPTSLFSAAGQRGGLILAEGVDFSPFAGTNFIQGSGADGIAVVLTGCKLPATMTPLSAGINPSVPRIDMVNCDSAGATYRTERWWAEGTQTTSVSAVHTGGASDGTTAVSMQIALPSTALWRQPFEAIPVVIWNAVTAHNVVLTMEAAFNGAALPNNDDIWLEVTYLGTAGSTMKSRATSGKASALASNSAWSASTALWGGSAAARQNTHAYVVGDQIAATGASSIVRLFVCTTAGTSSGSLPVAYASAVDGGSVTDGTAVFRAVMRFQMTLTLSTPQPQAAGYLYAYVLAAKASSTFWVDPIVTLS